MLTPDELHFFKLCAGLSTLCIVLCTLKYFLDDDDD